MTQPEQRKFLKPVAVGEYNEWRGWLGVPQQGKTQDAMREIIAAPAYRVAHDPDWNLPAKLWDGTPTNLHRHDSVREAAAAIAVDARGVHAISTETGDEVIDFALELAAASIEAHGGARGVPVVCYLDEITAVDGASVNRMGPAIRKLVSRRRKLNVGFYYSGQFAFTFHRNLISGATGMRVFRIVNDDDMGRLKTCGMIPQLQALVRELPPFVFVNFEPLKSPDAQLDEYHRVLALLPVDARRRLDAQRCPTCGKANAA